VLADIVRIIRSFRPDVILTPLRATARPTHGHHTASTVLALQAFTLAGDRRRFPSSSASCRRGSRDASSTTSARREPARLAPSAHALVGVEMTGTDPGAGYLVRVDRSSQPRHAQDARLRPGRSGGGRAEDRILRAARGATRGPRTSSMASTRRGTASRTAAPIGRMTEDVDRALQPEDPGGQRARAAGDPQPTGRASR
jgi:hypothetical protein